MKKDEEQKNDIGKPSSLFDGLTSISRFPIFKHRPALILLGLIVIIGVAQPNFLTFSSLVQLVGDTAVLFILATAATFVIMLGSIDLSLQAVASLASVIIALTLPVLGYASFPLALICGGVAGLLAGTSHVYLRLPSFIATLAVGGVLISAALVLSGQRSISLSLQHAHYVTWISGRSFGMPHEVFLITLVLIISHILLGWTKFGRCVCAIGAGEAAAFASGIRVRRYKLISFTLSGVFSAFAGMVLAGRMMSGSPTLANQMLLPAIAAVVLGGTAITGGVGSIWRTLAGAFIISLVQTGMTYLGVNVFAQQIVFGIVLIIAVAMTIDHSKLPIIK